MLINRTPLLARGREDALVRIAPRTKIVPNRRGFLARAIREEDILHALLEDLCSFAE